MSGGRSWALDLHRRLADTCASTSSPQAHDSHACVGVLRGQDHWRRQQSHRENLSGMAAWHMCREPLFVCEEFPPLPLLLHPNSVFFFLFFSASIPSSGCMILERASSAQEYTCSYRNCSGCLAEFGSLIKITLSERLPRCNHAIHSHI